MTFVILAGQQVSFSWQGTPEAHLTFRCIKGKKIGN